MQSSKDERTLLFLSLMYQKATKKLKDLEEKNPKAKWTKEWRKAKAEQRVAEINRDAGQIILIPVFGDSDEEHDDDLDEFSDSDDDQ